VARNRTSGEFVSPGKVLAFIRRSISSFNRFKANPYVAGINLAGDFDKLELYETDEQIKTIEVCLGEITPESYNGPHPPDHLACEPVCRDARMFQFVWESRHFKGTKMCLKLAIKAKRQSEERLVVIRLHAAFDPNKYSKSEHQK